MRNQRAKYSITGKQELHDSDGVVVYKPVFAPLPRDVNFCKIFDQGGKRMWPKGLSGATREVIDYMVLETDKKTNIFMYDPDAICSALSLSISTVNNSKAVILANDLIRKVRGCNYMFNPNNACSCDGEMRIELVSKYLALEENKKPKKERSK